MDSFINDLPEELDISILERYKKGYVTSGASVPSHSIDRLVDRIKAKYPNIKIFQSESVEKDILFPSST